LAKAEKNADAPLHWWQRLRARMLHWDTMNVSLVLHHAQPLTPKLKFSLALRTAIDPVTFLGTGVIAGIEQAADHPNYVQGAKGYAERFGSIYADGVIDIMIGGAILPSLLHQDPRYFYQGTGSKKSRTLHAISNPFVCKGDNGHWQPNYSSMVAIWPRLPSRPPTIRHPIAALERCSRISLSAPASAWPPAWHRSSSCAGLRPKPENKVPQPNKKEIDSSSNVIGYGEFRCALNHFRLGRSGLTEPPTSMTS
jgi:hypothetical protein